MKGRTYKKIVRRVANSRPLQLKQDKHETEKVGFKLSCGWIRNYPEPVQIVQLLLIVKESGLW